MTKKQIDVQWENNMAFKTTIEGHEIILDASTDVGGNNLGPTPKPLMLVALAGCTGMDVVSILKKMRVDFSYFNIKIEADITEEHPKHYTAIKIIYELKGNSIDLEKVEKAVKLSIDNYCGVSAIYKKVMDVSYKIRILD